jgi:hypothetical protein
MAVIDGKNRIMIDGPKADGTYIVEFKTDDLSAKRRDRGAPTLADREAGDGSGGTDAPAGRMARGRPALQRRSARDAQRQAIRLAFAEDVSDVGE